MVKKGDHISEETKEKMSLAHKGRKISEEQKEKLRNIIRTEEWRQNISKSLMGKHPTAETILKQSLSHKNQKHTKENLEKLRQSNIGRKHSIETRKKISDSRIKRMEEYGYLNAPETRIKMSVSRKEYFKKNPVSNETKLKISLSHKGVPKPPFTAEHLRRMSEAQKIPKPWCRGEKSHFWKGGRTELTKLLKASTYYKSWREQIFKRDNYNCTICGAKRNLHPHHKISLSKILTEYNIKNIEDAYGCVFLWDIANGITYCHDCHKKTDTYGINKKYIDTKV